MVNHLCELTWHDDDLSCWRRNFYLMMMAWCVLYASTHIISAYAGGISRPDTHKNGYFFRHQKLLPNVVVLLWKGFFFLLFEAVARRFSGHFVVCFCHTRAVIIYKLMVIIIVRSMRKNGPVQASVIWMALWHYSYHSYMEMESPYGSGTSVVLL
jgi:hypothetical protein